MTVTENWGADDSGTQKQVKVYSLVWARQEEESDFLVCSTRLPLYSRRETSCLTLVAVCLRRISVSLEYSCGYCSPNVLQIADSERLPALTVLKRFTTILPQDSWNLWPDVLSWLWKGKNNSGHGVTGFTHSWGVLMHILDVCPSQMKAECHGLFWKHVKYPQDRSKESEWY